MDETERAKALTWDDWCNKHYATGSEFDRAQLLALRRFPFLATARDPQRPPTGPWRTWLFMGGRGAVAHVGRFDALEDEMCQFGTDGFVGSPDRVDALVWAITVLMITKSSAPRIRAI